VAVGDGVISAFGSIAQGPQNERNEKEAKAITG
jgi:hypothetical protein